MARQLVLEALQMAQTGINTASYQRAVAYLREAADSDAAYYEPHFHLGFAALAAGHNPEALNCFVAAIRRDSRLGGFESAAWQTYSTLADLLEMEGRPHEALRYLNRFLIEFPQASEAAMAGFRIVMLADCGSPWFEAFATGAQALTAGSFESCIESLTVASELYPGSSAIHVLLARAQRGSARYEEAVHHFEASLQLDAEPSVMVEMGLTYELVGNSYVEEGCYRQALELHPRHPLALYHLGTLLWARKQRAESLPLLQSAVTLDPEAAWADKAWEQVEDLLQLGQTSFPAFLQPPIEYDTWVDDERGVSASYPKGAPLQAGPWLEVSDGSFRLSLRCDALLDEDTKGVMRRLQRASERVPQRRVEGRQQVAVRGVPAHRIEYKVERTDAVEVRTYVMRQQAMFELRLECAGGVWLQVREPLMAMLSGFQVVPWGEYCAKRTRWVQKRMAEGDLEAQAQAVGVLIEVGGMEAAEEHLARILKQDARHAGALALSGRIALLQNKLDAALKTLEKATGINPFAADAMAWLGDVYLKKSQPDKALKVLQRAVDLDAEPDGYRLLLADAAEAARRPELAEAQYRHVLQKSIDPWSVHLMMGNFYRRQKRPQEAAASGREAVALDPQGPAGYLLLGLANMDISYWDQAEKAFNKILTLDLNYEPARQALQELTQRKKSSRRY